MGQYLFVNKTQTPTVKGRILPYITSNENKVYIGGGCWDLSVENITNTTHIDFWEYDINTSSWSQLADMASDEYEDQGLIGSSAFYINGDVYVIGGCTQGFLPTESIYKYNVENNEWSICKSGLTTIKSQYTKGVLINGLMYVLFGGVGLYKYDYETNILTACAAFQGSTKAGFDIFSIENKLYVTGGSSTLDMTMAVSGLDSEIAADIITETWCYDTEADTWSQKASLATDNTHGLRFHASIVFGNEVYIIGSQGSVTDNIINCLYKYSQALDTWTKLQDPTLNITRAVTIFYNSNGYIFTGCSNTQDWQSTTYYKTCYEFAYLLDKPTNLISTYNETTGFIDLSWTDNSTEETFFQIERKRNDEEEYSLIGTTDSNIIQFTDENVDIRNYGYRYRVRAVKYV